MNGDSHLTPWRAVKPLTPECCRELRRRAIFECCKWDPQVEDVDTLAPFAIVLKESAWEELCVSAEALAAETLAVEQALLHRPELHRDLALPFAIRRALANKPKGGDEARHLRVMRFDFHPTSEGWRLSEVNSDVPGGYNEASAWAALVAERVSHGVPAECPTRRLVEAILDETFVGATVALVHATAYTDDRQVMTFLARQLRNHGLHPVLLAPDHLRWQDGQAIIQTDWFTGPAHFVFRFFPAEWLPNLGRRADWPFFFRGARTPLCNPATALLTQSKRWPLLRDKLGLELPVWREFLPETRDPRNADWQNDPGWVLKPALGRVGEWLGLSGVTSQREWNTIRRSLRWGARHWVAQRRFTPTPILAGSERWHICLGVFTINGRAAGVYGRLAPQPLINHLARDVAVLVERPPADTCASHRSKHYEPLGTL